MIKNFQFLKNIGLFDEVKEGAKIDLGKLTLIYGDNARGKTTLAEVLRSLADNDTNLILQRKRLLSSDEPHIVIALDDGSKPIVFQKGKWSRFLPNLAVFDDAFVEKNVYSGLSVNPQHRQNLHDLILGPTAVALGKELDDLTAKRESHSRELRNKESAILKTDIGSLTIDEFCRLPANPNVDQDIRNTENQLVVAQNAEAIKNTPELEKFALPEFKIDEIEEVLQRDLGILEAAALEQVQKHFAALGVNGEGWVLDGMSWAIYADDNASERLCPFCAQSLEGVSLIQHYQSYFSKEYSELKESIANTLAEIGAVHNESIATEFEHKLRILGEQQQFWGRYCEIEKFAIDTSTIFADWKKARESVVSLFHTKQISPLEKVFISQEAKGFLGAYSDHIARIQEINQQISKANQDINTVKEQADSANTDNLSVELDRLKATKIRHSSEMSPLCDAYLQEFRAKDETETRIQECTKAMGPTQRCCFSEIRKGGE